MEQKKELGSEVGWIGGRSGDHSGCPALLLGMSILKTTGWWGGGLVGDVWMLALRRQPMVYTFYTFPTLPQSLKSFQIQEFSDSPLCTLRAVVKCQHFKNISF